MTKMKTTGGAQNNRAFIIAMLLLGVSIALTAVVGARSLPIVVATNIERLPLDIDSFHGRDDYFSEDVYTELNADIHLYRHYRDAAGNQVSLYIGYYGTAKGGRTGHNPYACLPGAGWTILDSNTESISSKSGGKSSRVNYILAAKEGSYETVLHWYQSDRDKVLINGVQQNIQRFLGRVLHNRNDGAFVRVSVTSGEARIEEARERTRGFAGELLLLLPDYWPEEKEKL